MTPIQPSAPVSNTVTASTSFSRRGKTRDITPVLRRLIPAQAGNTRIYRVPPRPRPIHPRAGGEHDSSCSTVSRMSGSSPHGRGTLALCDALDDHVRFIPARAGTTSSPIAHAAPAAVHPAYGRGTPAQEVAKRFNSRFIPARAGNTIARRSLAEGSVGSSPHGRGTLGSGSFSRAYLRFIPARAGNT